MYTVWVKPPCCFLTFSPNGLEFLISFLNTYYTLLSTLDYKFFSIISNFDEVMPSVGIDVKELGGSAAEMFEILLRDW